MTEDTKITESFGPITGNVSLGNALVLSGPDDWAVKIHFNPPMVEVNTGLDWDGAAKQFWNAVARMAGQPSPFGW